MLKTIIRTTACLAVSATAFIAVTKMDARAAKPRSPSVPGTTEAKPAPSKAAPPVPAPKLTVAMYVPARSTLPAASTATDCAMSSTAPPKRFDQMCAPDGEYFAYAIDARGSYDVAAICLGLWAIPGGVVWLLWRPALRVIPRAELIADRAAG